MRFNHWSLGHRESGDVVVVNLSGNAANVRLLDSSNFQSYKAGRRHSYYGGPDYPVAIRNSRSAQRRLARSRRYAGVARAIQSRHRSSAARRPAASAQVSTLIAGPDRASHCGNAVRAAFARRTRHRQRL